MTKEPDWRAIAHDAAMSIGPCDIGSAQALRILAALLKKVYTTGIKDAKRWLPIEDAPKNEDVLVVTDRGERSVDRYETDPGIGIGWPISVIKYIPLPPPPEPKLEGSK